MPTDETYPYDEQADAQADAPQADVDTSGDAEADAPADAPKVSVAPTILGDVAEGTPPSADPEEELRLADERRAEQAKQLEDARKIFP